MRGLPPDCNQRLRERTAHPAPLDGLHGFARFDIIVWSNGALLQLTLAHGDASEGRYDGQQISWAKMSHSNRIGEKGRETCFQRTMVVCR